MSEFVPIEEIKQDWCRQKTSASKAIWATTTVLPLLDRIQALEQQVEAAMLIAKAGYEFYEAYRLHAVAVFERLDQGKPMNDLTDLDVPTEQLTKAQEAFREAVKSATFPIVEQPIKQADEVGK